MEYFMLEFMYDLEHRINEPAITTALVRGNDLDHAISRLKNSRQYENVRRVKDKTI